MKPRTHTPYIWLQTDEKTGTADCGCELNNAGDDGPALYQCKLHEAAPELLDALKKGYAWIVGKDVRRTSGHIADLFYDAIAKAEGKL